MRARVALFGYGAMGRRHAEAIGDVVDLVIVDPVVGAEAWAGPIAGAILAVPAELHARVATPLLAAGVPCLVEKPLATTLDDADALTTFPHAWVGHVERFNPAFLALREVAGSCGWTHADLVREGPRPDRVVGLDAALDLLVHDLDLLAELAPGDPVVEMEARTHDAPDVAPHEGIVVTVTLASGRTATLRAGRGLPTRRRQISLAGDGVLGEGVGEGASAPSRGDRPGVYPWADLLARRAWGDGAALPVAEGDPLRAQDLAFLALARGAPVVGPAPATSAEGREAVALALRALHLRDRASPRDRRTTPP